MQWRIQDFPDIGGANPKGQIVTENCMKLKKIEPREGDASSTYLCTDLRIVQINISPIPRIVNSTAHLQFDE